jgi:uncharacterized protein (TIGR03000 family)
MRCKLLAMLLSVAFFFLAASAVEAQRGRAAPARPAPAPSRPAPVRPTPAPSRPAYNPGYRPGYNPGYRPAYNYSAYRYGYPNYRYSYPYSYAYPYAWYGQAYVAPNYSFYYAPSAPYYPPTYSTPPVAPTAAVADIRVLVPDPQARVWFDGQLTNSTGTDRLYHTPLLAFGGNYSYRVRAAWMQGGLEIIQESVVTAIPGETAVVDFTRPSGESLPRP